MSRVPQRLLARPIAHRGLHDTNNKIVENSLPAIEAALAHGYGIEIDVQVSADGVPMVFHDDLLDRLTDQSGPVNARLASELQQIQLGGSNNATIPTLNSVLETVSGREAVLIEIKDQDGALGTEIGALHLAVIDVLAGYSGPAAVMSFNPHVINAIALAAPHLIRGLVSDPFQEAHWPDVPDTRRRALAKMSDAQTHDFISHKASDLGSAQVAQLKAAGLPVLCWTIRSEEEEAAARQIADNITFEGYLPVCLT